MCNHNNDDDDVFNPARGIFIALCLGIVLWSAAALLLWVLK